MVDHIRPAQPLVMRQRLGTPALVLGVFLVAVAINSVLVITKSSSASGDADANKQLWTYYVAGTVAILCAIGLMLYRRLVIVDKSNQRVTLCKGFRFWQRTKHEQFQAIEIVEIVYQKGDSDTSDSYALGLRERNHTKVVFLYTNQNRCRRDAEKIARYLNVPIREV